MKTVVRFTAITSLLLFFITAPSTSAAPEDRWLFGSSGYTRALELQRELKVPLVVYFYADWCGYCRALDSEYLPTAPVQQYLRGVVKVRINPEDGPAEQAIANRYGVTGYPSFFILRNLSAPRSVLSIAASRLRRSIGTTCASGKPCLMMGNFVSSFLASAPTLWPR